MRMMVLAPLLAVLSMATAHADGVTDEIAHLIGFVRASSCTFIRNGSEYTGGEAADHVQAKYDYYRDEIKTVDDFIEKAASRSVMSGDPYEVRCAGKTMPAADWIRAEDERYRKSHSDDTNSE